MAAEETLSRSAGDVASLSAGRPLDERIATAERVRTMLGLRVAEARARLAEAESKLLVTPEVIGQLGAIVLDAQRQVEVERARADDVVAGIAAHAELKAKLVLDAAEADSAATPRR